MPRSLAPGKLLRPQYSPCTSAYTNMIPGCYQELKEKSMEEISGSKQNGRMIRGRGWDKVISYMKIKREMRVKETHIRRRHPGFQCQGGLRSQCGRAFPLRFRKGRRTNPYRNDDVAGWRPGRRKNNERRQT